MKISPHVLNKFQQTPWSITEQGATNWAMTVSYESVPAVRAEGTNFMGDSIPTMTIVSGVAIVPICCSALIHGASALEKGFGAQSHDDISEMLVEAERNPTVTGILLSISCPGGTVSQTPELAAQIASLRKPCAAYSDSMACSSAYWLAVSATGGFFVTSCAMTGSVGCIAQVQNIAGMLAANGIKIDTFTSGNLKAAGNPYKEMTDVERGHFQSLVSQMGALFKADVRKKRPSVADSDLEGQAFTGLDAVARGLADGVVSGPSAAVAKVSAKAFYAKGELITKGLAAQISERVSLALKGRLSTTPPVPEARRATSYAEAFNADAGLRREFGTLKCYEYYMRGNKQPPPVIASSAPIEDPIETEWNNSPALRREFGSLAVFRAYKRAERRGHTGGSPTREVTAAAVNYRRPSPATQAKLESEWANLPLESKKEWGDAKSFFAYMRSHKLERYQPPTELEQ